MKKNPIIFIAMLIALAFTSCQMNTDDSVVIPPTYKITVTATNGTVTLSKTEAKAGEKVFVESISPNEGYTTNGLEQTFQSKDGKTLTLDFGTEDGKRYFVMPESDVVVTVTFKAVTPTDDTADSEEVVEPENDDGNKETEETVDEDDSETVEETPTPTTTPVAEASSYAVVYGDETLKSGLTLAQAEAYIAQIQLIETTDYSINKTTGIITLTASGYEKVEPYIDNGNLPTTPTNDDDDDGVVYAACRIFLPTVKNGTIEITNKGKDGNVVEKVYKEESTGAVYLGADEGDAIEIKLCPGRINFWESYKYFKYENELTVKDAFGEKIDLTKVTKYRYTFTMPKTYVKVELPYGFEEPYPLTLDKPTNTTAEILNADPTKEPGEEVYVMVVGNEVPRIEGLNRNGAYKDDDITFKDITGEVSSYVYAGTYDNGSTYEKTYVKIGGKSYKAANVSWDLAGAHFYSFIMPRDSITIKLTGN